MPAFSSSRPRPVWPLVALGALALYAYGAAARLAERPRRGKASSAIGGRPSTEEPFSLQVSRSTQPGRGRDAPSPWRIPWQGWKDILWRTYQEISEDRLLAIAAGVVFYGLLALFPAVTAIVSMYGLFADASTINQHLTMLAGLLPGGGVDIVNEQINRILSKGDAKLGFGFVFGLGLALWSANAGMKAIMDALNVVYDETEKRSFITLNLISLTLTFGAILSLLAAIAAVVVIPLVLNWVGLASLTETLIRVLRWPALLLLVLFGLAVLYRFGPSRQQPQWTWITPGSLVAAVLWLAGSGLLSWYLANFAHYDETYGSLGAAIGLMMWMWMSVIVVLLGAELNAEAEHQTARDTTVGGGKPLGTRGAAMADTVGAAQR
jgi:membrane protein